MCNAAEYKNKMSFKNERNFSLAGMTQLLSIDL